MYSLRDDNSIDVTRHQDLLHQSQRYSEHLTPLKTRITKTYKLFLAHAGQRMISWGYKMHQKSGIATEIPPFRPPYAIEKRS